MSETSAPDRSAATRVALPGVAAAPGAALGPWARPGRAPLPAAGRIAPGAAAAESETERVQAAAKAAATELRALATSIREAGHESEAAIFKAHAAIARDPALLDAAAAEIAAGSDGIGAIATAATAVAASLAALDDPLLAGRAADVADVADRIARHIAGLPTDEPLLAGPAVVVGEDLAPSLTATLPRDRILGIALAGSSPTSHAAILARAYGIPAVVGVAGLLEALAAAGPGAEIAIDGATGEVLVGPADDDRRRFAGLAGAARRDRERDLGEATLPARTTDGVEIALLANIGSPDEAGGARELGARGVGLFRTEFLFLERSSPPSEDEQVEAYRRVVEAFAGDPVTIRLLDIGGDKPIPYLDQPAEDNPFLGVRALRLAERRPDLFLTQLRALHRAAAAGPVKAMAPMVADARDAARFLDLAAAARDEAVAAGHPVGRVELGVMLEIPSAVIAGDTYLGGLAFASLGTNDLLQYALAVDRGNPALERYRDSLHPAMLRLIGQAVEVTGRAGVELSVCGEMAGDPVAAAALVGLGVRSLSMGAGGLPAVRRAIRGSSAATLAATARDAWSDRTADEVRERFRKVLETAADR